MQCTEQSRCTELAGCECRIIIYVAKYSQIKVTVETIKDTPRTAHHVASRSLKASLQRIVTIMT